MEKAKLINIRRSKKGKLIGEIQFKDGKTMQIPSGSNLDESLNNTECEVRRPKGPIISIAVNGGEIFSKPESNMSNRRDKKQQFKKTKSTYQKATARITTAHAPYNFIPLNDTVVEGQKIPEFDCFHEKYYDIERFNGYIECKLESLTPLYIRDTYTEEEISRKEENNKDNPNFFAPGGAVRIPGSSLRGMTRTLVEIMSWGKFGYYENKRLFYRGLADKSNLRREYQNNMSSYDRDTKKSSYKFNAGYLKKEGFDYYIIPAKIENGKQFRQVSKRNKDESFVIEKQSDGKCLVISGNMVNKKHDWLINEPDFAKKFPVNDIDIKEYRLDENRYEDDKSDGNLLRLISNSKDKITPCFYVLWKDHKGRNRVSFGHTGYFRLAYKYTIGDHIPEELKREELIDMAESIFGKTSSFASRVFFEDARLDPGQKDIFLSKEPSVPKILSGPKPTTFQHYLEQDPDGNLRNLNHWNTKGKKIRGYKLYWHRDGLDWEYEGTDEDIRKNQKLSTKIRPIKPGTKFTFRIRFENLSAEELGAMLFALELPNGCCHKLGMGKPLGLGSAKIKPVLFLINRKDRYTRLFDSDNWQLSVKQAEIQQFKDAFEKYILGIINADNNCRFYLWDIDRMKELKTMLNWDNTKIGNWHKETEYMTIKPYNEFKNRPILPSPTEVYDKLTK